jgi:hypothetical protein
MNAALGKALFPGLWHGSGETPLEPQQFIPRNDQFTSHAFALHAAHVIDGFSGPDRNLFGSQPRKAQVPPNGK